MPLQASLETLLARFAGVADTAAITAAIQARDRDRLETLLRQAWAALTPGLRAEFDRTMVRATEGAFRTGWRMVTGRPYSVPSDAVEHALAQSARRVTGMRAQGRRTIRLLVTGAMAGGASNQRLARELVRNGLPVTWVQAKALRRTHAELQARLAAGSLSEEKAIRRIEREAARMRRSRSRTIARTEQADAQGWGRQRAWNQSVSDGVIDDLGWEKKWLIRDDEKTTALCRQLSLERATPTGAFPTGGWVRPPAHPNCRCACIVRRIT